MDITCKFKNHEDCFARGQLDKTKCTALSNCDFGGRDCPFYKSKKQYQQERNEARLREFERGIG